jgi:hypothetical protein
MRQEQRTIVPIDGSRLFSAASDMRTTAPQRQIPIRKLFIQRQGRVSKAKDVVPFLRLLVMDLPSIVHTNPHAEMQPFLGRSTE